MPRSGSPRPEEPDTHLRVISGGLVADFSGCVSAVRNFLRECRIHPRPSITALEVSDGYLPKHRMPCEVLWLHP